MRFSFVKSGLLSQHSNEMAKLLLFAHGVAPIKLILHTYTYHNCHDSDSRIVQIEDGSYTPNDEN